MGLALDIALKHVRSRVRQTLVGVLGVATGVGFSVMMASLMEGSQRDFIRQLVDSLPHVSVTDQRREPPDQPAMALFDAVEIHSLSTETERRGIKNPLHGQVAAVSVGMVGGQPVLDLDYHEDSTAETDMNVVMNNGGGFIEVQGTAEGHALRRDELDQLLALATAGTARLFELQREALLHALPA